MKNSQKRSTAEKSQIQQEIKAVMDTLITGCENLDLKMAFGMFADEPDFLMMGTDGTLCDYQTYLKNNVDYLRTCASFKLTTFQEDIDRGSRVALLARDYVCVNTTALNPRPADLVPGPHLAQSDYYNDAQPLYPPAAGGLLAPPYYWLFQGPQNDLNWGIDGYVVPTLPGGIELVYRNVRLQQPTLRQQFADLRLMLGHSGWYAATGTPPAIGAPPDPAPANGDNEAEVQVQLDIRGVPWPWDNTGGLSYSFLRPDAADPATQDQSDHWYIDANDQLELASMYQ